MAAAPLLRVPPFPGARVSSIAGQGEAIGGDVRPLLDALRAARVGGSFWAAQPALPAGALILKPASRAQATDMLARAAGTARPVVLWLAGDDAARGLNSGDALVVSGDCDPWHMLDHADAMWVDAADELALLAAIAGTTLACFGEGRFAALDADATDRDAALVRLAAAEIVAPAYADPFIGNAMDAQGAIALLSFWRGLIDFNRPIRAAMGFARWKRATVEPLLWGGSPVRFAAATSEALAALPGDGALAIWKARVPPAFLEAAERRDGPLYEVEDGFIRSVGLGADCVPPLSILIDRLGVHYDPGRANELERLLETGVFSDEMRDRAEKLRRRIIETGMSKYAVGQQAMARPGGARPHILVTGQVEDDRSVRFGGGGVTGNLDLLRRARAAEPDAYLLYKPHPDVEAGHRTGHVPDAEALRYADAIVRDAGISALLDMVDGVHVITSLAGFEGLIRGKAVTTHGMPFYAGWGLTRDLGDIPVRRTAVRDVLDMVAAVLMVYPRYLDPVTQLPCPPEILMHRLVAGVRKENRVIVSARQWIGMARRRLAQVSGHR